MNHRLPQPARRPVHIGWVRDASVRTLPILTVSLLAPSSVQFSLVMSLPPIFTALHRFLSYGFGAQQYQADLAHPDTAYDR